MNHWHRTSPPSLLFSTYLRLLLPQQSDRCLALTRTLQASKLRIYGAVNDFIACTDSFKLAVMAPVLSTFNEQKNTFPTWKLQMACRELMLGTPPNLKPSSRFLLSSPASRKFWRMRTKSGRNERTTFVPLRNTAILTVVPVSTLAVRESSLNSACSTRMS